MRHWPLLLTLVLLPHISLAGEPYDTYQNARFGYSIAYPGGLLYPQGESDNGDGQRFVSRQEDASLIVYGSNNALGQSLEGLYAEASRGGTEEHPGKVVTYQVLKRRWFVVSGYDEGKVFYQKTYLNDDQFKTFYFEYDADRKALYDPVSARISKSFRDLSLP